MAEIMADGTRIKECGKDIIELVGNYETIINSLFQKLEKLNAYGWSGNSADDFVRSLRLEKPQYLKLSKSIKAYGNELYNVGESVNGTIRRWEQ